jgi:endoglucanase
LNINYNSLLLTSISYVILDPHNSARYLGQIIGTPNGPTIADFADLWTKLTTHYKSNPKIIYGLMNEPRNMSTELWRAAAQSGLQAIRLAGGTQLVLVPGNGYTGAQSWYETW